MRSAALFFLGAFVFPGCTIFGFQDFACRADNQCPQGEICVVAEGADEGLCAKAESADGGADAANGGGENGASDSGAPADAGPGEDAGTPLNDAGPPADAGAPPPDAGVDPTCTTDEVLVVLSEENGAPSNPTLRYFDILPGGLSLIQGNPQPLQTGELNVDPGDLVGFGSDGDRWVIVGEDRVYALAKNDLTQINVRGDELSAPGFSTTAETGAFAAGWAFSAGGNGLDAIDLNTAFSTKIDVEGGYAQRPLVFNLGGQAHLGVAFDDGYRVYRVDAATGPVEIAGTFDGAIFGEENWGPNNDRRGIAYFPFDGASGELLLGDETEVIRFSSPSFGLANPLLTWLLPNNRNHIEAIAVYRDDVFVTAGSASSGDATLFRIPWSSTPPAIPAAGGDWRQDAIGNGVNDMAVSCHHVVVAVFGSGSVQTIRLFDRQTLQYQGGLSVAYPRQIQVVDRPSLGL
jgi:hypothetical protein